MVKKIKSIIIIAIILFNLESCCCDRKLGQNGNSIHPLSLKSFFPSPVDGHTEDTIDLTSMQFSQLVVIDSSDIMQNKGNWYRSYFSNMEYIDYKFIGKIRRCASVILYPLYQPHH